MVKGRSCPVRMNVLPQRRAKTTADNLEPGATVLGRAAVLPDPLVPMIFHNRWWLDAATDGRHEEIEVRSGAAVARLPYLAVREWPGYRVCTMPQMTHSLGWAVDLGVAPGPEATVRHIEITRLLARRLARFAGFHHKLGGQITDTFAFGEAGYTTGVQFTFEIAPQPNDATWRAMRDKTRNVIRRAGERFAVDSAIDPDTFASIYEANLRRRNLINTAPRMVQVCAAALAHDSGRFFAARDDAGAVEAAVFIVWDHRTAYYLLATRAPKSDNGAISLLVWHAIRDAHARGLVFDFDGVGTPGSRLFFTGFGGVVTPRYIVSRYSWGSRAAQGLRHGANRLLGQARA